MLGDHLGEMMVLVGEELPEDVPLDFAPANPSKDILTVVTVFYSEDGARVAPITDFTRAV